MLPKKFSIKQVSIYWETKQETVEEIFTPPAKREEILNNGEKCCKNSTW